MCKTIEPFLEGQFENWGFAIAFLVKTHPETASQAVTKIDRVSSVKDLIDLYNWLAANFTKTLPFNPEAITKCSMGLDDFESMKIEHLAFYKVCMWEGYFSLPQKSKAA